MNKVARALAGLSGWRRVAVAAALGALATLAFPPFHLLPVLLVSFPGLLWMLGDAPGLSRGRRLGRALATGWWFGFGHFVAGLYWITNALFVDAAAFGWLAPFAVSGLSLYFAIYPALAAAGASALPAGPARVTGFAALWAICEWLRGTLLTGFPWNPAGSALAVHPASMQGAALVGVYGLTLMVAFIAASPAAVWGGARMPARTAVRWAVPGAAVLLALALAGGGWLSLVLSPGVPAGADAPRLRVVQANIDQQLKWQPDLARAHYLLYLELTRSMQEDSPPDAVIWPETALPIVFDGSAGVAQAFARAAPSGGLVISGAVRRSAAGDRVRLWNSIIAARSSGAAEVIYDKHHLVPFGEYVPLRDFNPFPKLTAGRIDFSPGAGPGRVALDGLPPFASLICYEAIFPAATVPEGPRPAWLLNVTNDAWFGRSTGPYQHLAAARMRAVEEGLPLVRAANTGISALIDSRGRIVESLPLGTRGILDIRLPPPRAEATLFTRWGNLAFWLLVMFTLLCAALLLPRSGADAAPRAGATN